VAFETGPFAGQSIEQEGFDETFYASNGVVPSATIGHATGGGQIAHNGGEPTRVTVAFEVGQPELGRVQGRCSINDPATGTRVKCIDATTYGQAGNTATWTGHAEINGVLETYRITVIDTDEPNRGADTFTFESDSYTITGNVTRGNVQVHQTATP
jgi:hypothetical protein